MKQTRALAFISAVVLLAGSAAAPVAAADSVESLKTVSTSDNLGGVAQVSPRINRWVTYKGYKYWFNSKGKMVKDAIIGINGKIYCFDARGRLMTSRFIRKGSIVYFADRRGQFLTGWQIIDGKKYYFSPKTGEMIKNRTINGTTISANGEAPLSRSELLELKCQEILSQITNDSMSRSDKIQACYNYMVSHSNFSYMTWRNYSYYDGWDVDYAYEMLTTRMGNCYNFAAAFAHLTNAAGCDVTLVRGRIHGSRDGAADGFTRHCWTIVDGAYYDTELAFAGSAYVCGSGGYPLSCQVTGYDTL